mgnify:CR=1 FL=1
MADTKQTLKLTSNGAMKILQAAMEKATAMGVPQCITIVDPGGHMLAFCRMAFSFLPRWRLTSRDPKWAYRCKVEISL